MHPRPAARSLLLSLVPASLCLQSALSAQVVEWHFAKSAVYEQVAANVMPAAPWVWGASALVVTSAPSDAGLVTLSGGNLSGSLQLVHEGGGVWVLERDYATQAAMNAELPSNTTYTLTLSGGTLGVQTQAVVVGPERYPNTPYLTGTSFGTAGQFPWSTATTLTWNHPGVQTQASGLTVFDVSDRAGDPSFAAITPGAVMSATVPANTLNADDCHWGWLEFTIDVAVPAGGFGVAGTSHHTRGTDFQIRTWSHPTPPCAWSEPYGASCAGLELHGTEPILGTSWDLTTVGVPAGFSAFTLISLFPQSPPLPLGALGINAPGCAIHVDAHSIMASVRGVGVNGQMSISIPVPAASSFGGIVLSAQTFSFTPRTPANIGTSNAVQVMLGS